MKLVYLSLQETTEGQAAYAHVHEIIKGLASAGWDTDLCQVQYDRSHHVAVSDRVKQCLSAQRAAITRLRGSDVVYVRLHFLSAPLVWVARLCRKPVVVEINGTVEDAVIAWPRLRKLRRLVDWLEVTQIRRASLAICVTENLEKWVRGVSPGTSTEVISNAADTDHFSPTADASLDGLELPDDFVVFFGALSRWQGVRTMLSATESSLWPPARKLVLIGAGAEEPMVAAAASRSTKVVYLGQRPYAQIPSIIRRSRGSLIVKEGPFDVGGLLPLKLYESLAVGLPVVVTDYPGIRDVVLDNDFGAVIHPGDDDGLARAVASLDTRDPHASVRAREWTVAGNSWTARAKRTDAILRRLVERMPSARRPRRRSDRST